MKNLLEHVEQSVRERKLILPGARILVAVSGGLDSVVLLYVLHEFAARFDWKLCIAHFNHQLRGRASDADERFVKRTAVELGVPIRVGRGAVTVVAKRKGLSVEMAARELRHQFLATTAHRMKCSAIAVAHHADDQVELFLLRLLRGAGGDGLAGMKYRSASPVDKRTEILRPFLNVTKETLEQFARVRQIQYREDASNASMDILRNRVRHELLPLLRRRFQSSVDRAILRVMDITGADAEVADQSARAWLKLQTAKRKFAEQRVGLQRRIVQVQLREQNIRADFELIELLRNSAGQPITVNPNLRVQCDATGHISRVGDQDRGFQHGHAEIQLRGKSGMLKFSGAEIKWSQASNRGASPGCRVPNREVFDVDQIGAHIVVRHWRAGDRFQPIGMGAAVKLQDWFTNRKIRHEQRRKLIVATTAGGEIFWVEGERIGERFKLTSHTRRRLIWSWKRSQTT